MNDEITNFMKILPISILILRQPVDKARAYRVELESF